MRGGYKMTDLGEIPEDWDVIKLGDYITSYAGGTPLRSNSSYYLHGTIPWVKSGEVNQSSITSTEESITEIAVRESSARIIQPNSILIALYGATAGNVGKLKIKASSNQAVLAVNSKNEALVNDFVYVYLKWATKKLLSLTQGSGQPNLSKGIIDSLLIPLPPLAEQQKIATILSTVDEKIEVIDAQITQTRELKKGLMQKLLTRGIGHTKYKDSVLGEIPESWEVVSADKLGIEFIDGDRGVNYPSSADFSEKGFCLFLSAKNVTKNGFQFDDCQFISKEKDDQLRKGKLSLWDLVITTRGSVGNIALFDNNVAYSNMRLNSGMVIVRDKDQIFDKNYLYQYFKSSLFQNQVENISFGSAQPQLTIKELKKIKLLNLPLNEQLSIAEVLKTIDSKLNVLANKWETYQQLKKGLMQQLLTGKVRTVQPELQNA